MRGVFGQHPSLKAVDLQAAKCIDESDPERFGHLPPHRLLRASMESGRSGSKTSRIPQASAELNPVESGRLMRDCQDVKQGIGTARQSISGSSSQLGPEKLRSPPTRNSRYWC